MKICFISNFMNHHQKPIADELFRLMGDDFCWIATTPTDLNRIKLGYDDLNESIDYVICSYKNKNEYEKAYQYCLSCDCLISAYELGDVVKQRIKNNKLTFICTERICKKNMFQLFKPRVLASIILNFSMNKSKNLYLLSIGKYAAFDYSILFAFLKKSFKWGYFVDTGFQHVIKNENKDRVKIFWASRFIDWKHPEYMIYAAKKLKKDGIDFYIEMAGEGPLIKTVNQAIVSNNLTDVINVLGPLNHLNIRQKMLYSDIFCLTSDRREGWGAVIGEALSSQCVVIASNKAGASSFLLNNQTGVIFKSGSKNDFYKKLKNVIMDFDNYKKRALNGCLLMNEVWNPAEGAKRLVNLVDNLINNKNTPYLTGPCSPVK